MLRTLVSSIALALVLGAAPAPATADNATVNRQVAQAARESRRDFKSGVREAQGLLNSASTNFTRGLKDDSKTLQEAGADYGAAVATYLHTVTDLADAAARDVAQAASQSLLATSADETCTATLSGAGGALDRFSDQMQTELDRIRKRTVRSARRFLNSMSRIGGNDVQGRRITTFAYRIHPLVFARRPSPRPNGEMVSDMGARPLRVHMWMAVKVRLVGVAVTVSGTGDPAISGQFDVRLAKDGHEPVGDFLKDGGGPAVNANGNWTATDLLGNPAFASGNRVILLGVEPVDKPVIGLDPTRFLQMGVVGIR